MWYYFGGMTLFLFLVQIGTGILLMLYYRPSAEGAYESVKFIMTQVPFGWLIRSIHSWSANLMVAAAFVHLFSVFFLKAYRAPRELTWVSGFVLLMLSMGFGFSGYLLPWNKLAFFATQVGTDIAGAVPVVGGFIRQVPEGRGLRHRGNAVRFYGWHVAILPAITTAVLLLHLLMVQRHGMSVPRRGPAPAGQERPPDAVRSRFSAPGSVRLGGGARRSWPRWQRIFPWELGEKADPFAPAFADIKPEWFFMFMFQIAEVGSRRQRAGHRPTRPWRSWRSESMGLVAFLVPLLDRGHQHARGRSPLFTAARSRSALHRYRPVLTAMGLPRLVAGDREWRRSSWLCHG